jgi:hypothetical protein
VIEARATTRRGLAVIAWALGFTLACSLLVERRGLRWIQGVVWPSDLYSFQQVERGPVDVAILGSSRAAFGFVPTSLDRCLSQRLRRETHTVNLSRAFTTAWAADLLARDLLQGPRRPELLVLVVEPELFDEGNPRLPINVSTTAGLADVPGAVISARDLAGAFAALRPLARGPETLALYASGRWDSEAWLRWLMLHHGGGLFCTGAKPCRAHNEAVEDSLDEWWGVVNATLLPELERLRFPSYRVGDGPVHAHTESLLRWAEQQGIHVVVAELPRMEAFDARLPAGILPSYREHLAALVRDHGLTHHPVPAEAWTQQRTYFVDVEHLNAAGAHRASRGLCDTIAPLLGARPGAAGE